MRARLAPVVLALCLAVAGCSDDGGAAGPTLPPITESPSEAPTPTAVTVPSEATAATPEGAAEFGRFFYEAVEAGFRQRDASMLETISAPTCEICQRYIASIKQLAEKNERLEGNAIDVTDSVSPEGDGRSTTVTVFYNNTASRRFDASGQLIVEEPARENVVVELVLERPATTWVVQEVRAG